MSLKTINEMTSPEIHEAIERGLTEVARRLESGELDGAGRYYTDEELREQREQYTGRERRNGSASDEMKRLKTAS